MSITPDVLEPEFSLTTAATRLDFLSRRDNGDTALNTVRDDDEDSWSSFRSAATSLDVHESLELLALGEVVARKAHDSRLVGIRAALRGGASWEQIAAALDVTPERGLGRLPRPRSPASSTTTPRPPPANWPGPAPADRRGRRRAGGSMTARDVAGGRRAGSRGSTRRRRRCWVSCSSGR